MAWISVIIGLLGMTGGNFGLEGSLAVVLLGTVLILMQVRPLTSERNFMAAFFACVSLLIAGATHSLSLTLTALTFLLQIKSPKKVRLLQGMALVNLLIPSLLILCYLYGAHNILHVSLFADLTPPMALALVTLNLGFLLIHSTQGVIAVLIQPHVTKELELKSAVGHNMTADITDRKKQEEALRSSEKRYRDVIELATDGIFETGADGSYIDVNPAGCAMLGYTKEEIIGRTAQDLVADEDRDRLIGTLKKLQNQGEAQLISAFDVKRKDGSILPAEVSVKVLPNGRRISFLRDMTYRKQVEAALSASEQKYRSLVEGAYDSILVADARGQIVLINEQLGRKFGYTQQEVIGQSIEMLLPERYRERHIVNRSHYAIAPLSRPMGTGLDLWARKKDGSEFPVDVSLSPSYTDHNLRMTAIIRDITERKRYEDQQGFLSQIAKALNEVMNYEERAQVVADGLIAKLADNCVVRIYEDGQLLTRGVATRDPEKKEILRKAVLADTGLEGPYGALEVVRSRKTILVEDARSMIQENKLVDESMRTLAQQMGITSYMSTPLVAMDNVVGTLAISMSVSGRRFAADDVTFLEIVANRCAVAIENARLYRQAQIGRMVVDNLPALVGYWDQEQRCRFANRAYSDWFGVTAEQMLGRTLKQVLGPVLYAQNQPFISGALEGKVQHFERELTLQATGELRHTQAVYLPEIVEGYVHGFFVLVTDVTELKRTQMLALSEKERAEAAVHLREEVLSIVSHDLRNPLAAIEMALQVLTSIEISQDIVHQYVQKIHNSAQAMQTLIADLLDFGKIQGGAFTVEQEAVDAATIVNEALDAMNARASVKRVQLRVDVATNLPPLFADKRRIVQVIWNLVGNAIKFTPEGGQVVLSVAADEKAVRFSVADTGPGIPKEDLPKVFDRFWQARKTASLGSGLGLAIAKGIVTAHGGQIAADSEPGQGAIFSFTIPTMHHRPCPLPVQTMAGNDSKTLLTNIRILIVDDAEENLALLRFILEKAGARVSEALSVAEALQKLASDPPDVMITDIEMPDGSGYDLIEKIRRSADKAKHLRIAALTGYTSEKEIKKMSAAGFDACLSKPISPQKLLASVRDLAHHTLH